MSQYDTNSVSRSDCQPWRDEETLRYAYHEKGLSSRDCATLLGCSGKDTVLKWMERHEIDRDPGPHRKGPWWDEETLREEYSEKERSMNDLADSWGTSTATIHNWLHRHGIQTREAKAPDGEDHWNWSGGNPTPGERECPECGKAHTPSDNRVRYCSRECHFESMRDRVSLECETCGGEFEVTSSREDTAQYCSTECRDAYDEIECKQCGDEFEAYPSRNRKFCSQECSHAWHTGENHHNRKERIERDCETCGKTLELVPWDVKRRDRTFCDTNCRAEWMSEWVSGRHTGEDHWLHGADPEDHPMWNGGPATYGPGWNEKKRESVRERDGYECAICGMDNEEHQSEYDMALHVHHIVPAREFDDPEPRNDMDNLVSLCLPCHMKYEGVPLDVDT